MEAKATKTFASAKDSISSNAKYRRYMSKETLDRIEKANSHNVGSVTATINAAPGVIYGVADIVAGEKATGIASLCKSAPAVIKSRVDAFRGKIATFDSVKSFSKDIKDKKTSEKMEAMSYFLEANAVSIKDNVKAKINDTKDSVQKIAGMIKNKSVERPLPYMDTSASVDNSYSFG